MKTLPRLALAISLVVSASFAMDDNGWASSYESIAAFDKSNPLFGNRPGYVKPIITNISTILNSNWVSSAGVPRSLTFEAGMPFAIVPINGSDREYGNGNPTIFGDNDKNNAMRISTDACSPEALALYGGCSVVNGNENLNGLGAFTYPYLQVAASFFHARFVLRGMYLPSISQLRKFNLFGFGLQYSFGHFFQYMLPRVLQPLDVSLMFGYNTSGIGYKPDEFQGSLDLDISAYTVNVVLGYRPFSFIEAMVSLGYQYADMKSSGHLVHKTDPNQFINPNLTVKGDNGFRFGFEVAFQLGSYHPVVGYEYVGKTSFTTNLLYFKQSIGTDKTPAEIAKEKAAAEPESKDDDDIKVENTPEEAPAEADQEPSADESESDSSDNADESEGDSSGNADESGDESDSSAEDSSNEDF